MTYKIISYLYIHIPLSHNIRRLGEGSSASLVIHCTQFLLLIKNLYQVYLFQNKKTNLHQ